ncbi:single-stranded-DNA-specific exonuclease RecJ [Pseudomonadota bacterium]
MKKKSIKGYFWKLKEFNKERALDLYQKLEISEPISRLLSIKNITAETLEYYTNPRLKNSLPNPFHLIDMGLAVERVISAIKNNEKVTIFGDYDVDGATSSALLKRFFRYIGIDASVYIPDRVNDGYGPNIEVFERIINNGTNLIICVDCGTTAYEPIKFARENNVDTIVVDHHIGGEVNLGAKALVNPNRLDETSKYTNLAAVGVTFLFCVALNQKLREVGYYNSLTEPNLMSMLDIVALGTVCDVMPLTGLNRVFVTQGLKIIQNTSNTGLKALVRASGIDGNIDVYHLGFILGPRINAGGRVGESDLGSELLSTENETKANEIAYKLELYNNERKVLEREILDESMKQVEENELYKEPVIFVKERNWHEGVIGIVASRIKDKYQKPTVIVSILSDRIAKASCRSIKNIHIGNILIEAKDKGLLIKGGGHELAGGFTAKEEKLEKIKDFFNRKLGKDIEREIENRVIEIDLLSHPEGINLELAKEIESLGPYGAGNHKPLVLIKNVVLVKVDTMGRSAEHLRCIFSPDKIVSLGSGISSVAFNVVNTKMYEFLLSSKGKKIDVVGTIEINKWNNKEMVQFFIEDVMDVGQFIKNW